MKNILLASTSKLHGTAYLEYLLPELEQLFSGVSELIFIPFARPGGLSHSQYTKIAAKAFKALNIKLKGLHTFNDPIQALQEAQGVFTGGGNTFLLVTQLYKLKLMQALRETVLNGAPYLGSSAGSNICGPTMQTTNDMPIIHPPSFKTLGVVPFNINPHYQDPESNSKHMGETRATRINEFHTINTIPVIGLREGSWIRVKENEIVLKGALTARIFKAGQNAYEIDSGAPLEDLS
ncbi:MAG: dipeptidase PepE [Flavobacteriaceae bacterium]|nr:dipeptidase PepE [Flavobacteriaceae bacterium]